MKNIHILPTDKPSKLFNCFGKLEIGDYVTTRENLQVANQNIYITNNEEIKEGDYCISHLNIIDEGKIHNSQTIFNPKTKEHLILLQSCKKIILTTDTDLIQDDVQAIDDEFLEWFVKNPSCEYVETYSLKEGNEELGYHHYKYEIVIPKEKPKQETLEERETYWDLADAKVEQNNTIDLDAYAEGVQDGVKWQMDKQSDFIIGFLEFIEGTYSYSNIYDHWYLHADTSKTYSKKQLLEVYLKRNKL